MADNFKSKAKAAQEAILAEIIIDELEKFKDSHDSINSSIARLLNQYSDVNALMAMMDKRDNSLAEILRTILLTQERYAKLLDMSMTVANELKEIKEQGISIEPNAIDKLIHAVNKANKPIRIYIILLTYGVIAAFGILLLMAI
jgi:hypothetical protein